MKLIIFLSGCIILGFVVITELFVINPQTSAQSKPAPEYAVKSTGNDNERCCPAYRLSPGASWRMYRGHHHLSGSVDSLPDMILNESWRFKADSQIKSGIALKNRRVYFATTKGTMYSLRAESGQKNWKRTTNIRIESPPLIRQLNEEITALFTGNQHGILTATDVWDGRIIWKFDTGGGQISAGATVLKDTSINILFGSHDSYVYKLDASTGEKIWKIQTENYVNSTPIVTQDSAFIAGCDGFFRAISLSTGTETAKIDLDNYIPSSPAYKNGIAYLALHGGKIVAVNTTDLTVLWQAEPENIGEIYSPPVANQNHVVVADAAGRAWIMDAEDGSILNSITLAGEMRSEPLIDKERLLLADTDGIIYCFELATGKEIWRVNHSIPITGPMAVVQDHLFVSDLEGYLTLYTSY